MTRDEDQNPEQNQDHPRRDELVAYVDGLLDGSQVEEIKALIKTDTDAADFIDRLRGSALPYRKAFEPLLSLPLPKGVKAMVEESEPTGVSAPGVEITDVPKTEYRRFYSGRLFGFAASFALGAMVTVIAGGALDKPWVSSITSSITPAITEEERTMTPGFVESVSQYQSLYQRATVNNARPDVAAAESMLLAQFERAIEVPDFTAQGLTFKRGQLLQMNGKPLVQLVYLADEGVPLALCITFSDIISDDRAAAPKHGQSYGLKYGYWQRGALEFVLVGDHSHEVSTLTDEAIAQLQI